ncbi:hypothetical protein [Sphingobium sp. EM0848]|uniref:alpha-glutamyl/putrescinyl thymine pyrophosphorylase clade 3 protein n=1 Tax=Sphingobium sp. EM0848 TaxID=2743473 RepID=UPI00159CC018
MNLGISGATGPGSGARLLIDGVRKSGRPNKNVQLQLDTLDLGLNVGMTVMEDALCNWQKSPRVFMHYVG